MRRSTGYGGRIFVGLLGIIVLAACRDSKSEPEPVTVQEIATHVRFLSSDLAGEKSAGGPGSVRTEAYLEEYFKTFGLESVFGSSYRQRFVLRGIRPDPNAVLEIFSGKVKIVPRLFEDFVVITQRRDCPAVVSGELVYGGSWMSLCQENEDDTKSVNLKDKILLVDINGQGNTPDEGIDERAATGFEPWSFCLKERARTRAGAAGVLLIYGGGGEAEDWNFLRDSWSRERFTFPDGAGDLNFQGWIKEDAFETVLDAGGLKLDLKKLREESKKPDFSPRPLGMLASMRQSPAFRSLGAMNVAGMIRAGRKDTDGPTIVISAPCGRPERNEALIDNDLAAASLLALAAYYGQRPEDRKANLVFVGLTAEEEGVLGGDYFAGHLPFPVSSVSAAISIEPSGFFGQSGGIHVRQARRSDFDQLCRRSAKEIGLPCVSGEKTRPGLVFPSAGRSFARAGIPTVCLGSGFIAGGREGRDYDGALRIIRGIQEIVRRLEDSSSLDDSRRGAPLETE